MSIRTYSQVRSDFATRIAALSGWSLVDVPYSQFDVGAVPDAVAATNAHLAFAVGVESSEDGGRQKLSEGIKTLSEVGVRFLSRISARDKLTSIDAGLDAEVDLLGQLLEKSASWPVNFGVRYLRTRRTDHAAGGWRMHELTFRVDHLVRVL